MLPFFASLSLSPHRITMTVSACQLHPFFSMDSLFCISHLFTRHPDPTMTSILYWQFTCVGVGDPRGHFPLVGLGLFTLHSLLISPVVFPMDFPLCTVSTSFLFLYLLRIVDFSCFPFPCQLSGLVFLSSYHPTDFIAVKCHSVVISWECSGCYFISQFCKLFLPNKSALIYFKL